MDDDELKKIEDNLKNVEFNNEEEDEDIINEENGTPKKKKDNKNLIIIILGIVIVVLLLIVLLFATGVFGGSKNTNTSSKDSNNTNTSSNDDTNQTGLTVDIANSDSTFISSNYLYVVNDNKKYISNLEGGVIEELSGKYRVVDNKYVIQTYPENERPTKYTIKAMDDNKLVTILETDVKGYNGLLVNENKKMIGIYDKYDNGTTLYIIDGNKYKTINLTDNTSLYTFSVAEGENNYIYNNYGIIVKNNLFGIYDIKNQKTLVSPTYESISYLTSDKFVFVREGKSGIIDKNGKQLLENKYDAIEYSNDLYFVGTNKELHILDPNFKEVGNKIDIDNLSDYTYNSCCGHVNPFTTYKYKDKVLIKLFNNNTGIKYLVVDKDGTVNEYDFQYFNIYGNYLVTTKSNSSVITLYNSSMKKIADFDTKNKDNDLESFAIFLDKYAIINDKKLFDLSTGSYKYDFEALSRSYQGYYVELKASSGVGTVTVSLDNNIIGSIDNVKVRDFLTSENNGIKVTKDYFIFSAGEKNLIIKK